MQRTSSFSYLISRLTPKTQQNDSIRGPYCSFVAHARVVRCFLPCFLDPMLTSRNSLNSRNYTRDCFDILISLSLHIRWRRLFLIESQSSSLKMTLITPSSQWQSRTSGPGPKKSIPSQEELRNLPPSCMLESEVISCPSQ
jgi:hypothetical protein